MPQLEQTSVFASLIFWSFVSFGIFLFLLNKYAFPPILAILEERKRKIQGDIDDAEKQKSDARQLKEDLDRQLKEAHEKAKEIVRLAESESKKIQEKTLRETDAKCKQMQEQATQEIARNQEKLMSEIRGQLAELTVASTEKILRKSLSDDDKNRLVDDAISEALGQLKN